MSKQITQTDLLFVDSLFQKSSEKAAIVAKSVSIERVTGDASARRYYRIITDKEKFIACLNDPNGTLKSFLSMQMVLSAESIRVPKIYDFIEDKGYMLLEDLGDETLLKKLSSIGSVSKEYEIYKKILNDLIKLQLVEDKKYLNHDFTRLSFDMPKYFQEIEFTLKYFIESYLSHNLSDAERTIIINQFELVCKPIVTQHFVLTHRDFHSRNIMCKNSESVIIDFQDARMGIPQYDLVSLLEDCYYSIDSKNLDNLKEYYWENFIKSKKLQSSYEEFLRLYDLMAIQRTFKAIGSFSYIYNLRKDERYLKYIGYSFEKLRTFLMRHDELKPLRMILSKLYYEY